MPGPLDGVRIIDLSVAIAGPMATGMLADQGADVVKVEAPGIGDIGRWVGVAVNGMGAMFHMANRGKRSIVLDLRQPRAVEILRALARGADVVVQNFRPGVVERLGVDYASLRKVQPDLIYVSVSGFGSTGPYAQRPAYDNVVQAYSGLAMSQADPETGEPRFIQQVAADKITALTAAQAVCAALFARQRGAGGQHVELAMLDAVVGFLWMDAAGNEVLLESDGSLPSSFTAALRAWRYADGWGTASPVSDADFAGMCRAFGIDGADDPRVATLPQRRQHPDLLQAIMEKIQGVATTLATAEATRRLEREGVPCGVALPLDALHEDPHVRATGLLVESTHPIAGPIRQPRPAARFERTPSAIAGDGPAMGQHTDEVLAELGLADELEKLRADGIVA